MMIKTYNVNGYVARMKTHLTYRRHLRVAVDSRPVNDYDGLYIYMSKQNLPKFYFNNKKDKDEPIDMETYIQNKYYNNSN